MYWKMLTDYYNHHALAKFLTDKVPIRNKLKVTSLIVD
jgi:hypothetical protein